MSRTSGNATSYAPVNYVGEVFQIAEAQTRLLSATGGLNGGRAVKSTTFELSQTWAPAAGSQPANTENELIAGITAGYYARTQESNVCQAFPYKINVSYAKQGNSAAVSGVANIDGINPVSNEAEWQTWAALKQMAIDVNYTMFNGVYAGEVNADTDVKTRGIIPAISTNSVNASSAALTTTMVNTLVKSLLDNGADLMTIVLYANDKLPDLNNLYGLQDRSFNVGGLMLQTIYTPYGMVAVDYDSAVPSGVIAAVDVSKVRLAIQEIPGKGFIFEEETAKIGFAEGRQLFGSIGVDYGTEAAHGKIYDIA